jgi:hypothetical protein
LIEYLNNRHSTRLGIYFECLWRFFIEQDPALTLICHNLPVYQQKRTVGEFDLIYYCHHRQHYYHLELAIKFYMGWLSDQHTSSDQQGLWIGPNSRDRLDLKLTHLLQHQTKLGQTEAGKEALAALNIQQLRPELSVKGWLFYPANNQQLAPPDYINREHQQGQWLRLSTFEKSTALKNKEWVIIERSRWLSPVLDKIPCKHQQIMNTLKQHFSQHTQSVMLAELDKEGNEQARWFICNDPWPTGEVSRLSPRLI